MKRDSRNKKVWLDPTGLRLRPCANPPKEDLFYHEIYESEYGWYVFKLGAAHKLAIPRSLWDRLEEKVGREIGIWIPLDELPSGIFSYLPWEIKSIIEEYMQEHGMESIDEAMRGEYFGDLFVPEEILDGLRNIPPIAKEDSNHLYILMPVKILSYILEGVDPEKFIIFPPGFVSHRLYYDAKNKKLIWYTGEGKYEAILPPCHPEEITDLVNREHLK